jgi:hypothetical protein
MGHYDHTLYVWSFCTTTSKKGMVFIMFKKINPNFARRLKLLLLITMAAFLCIMLLTSCADDRAGRLEAAGEQDSEAVQIGQGETTFRFEVLDLDDNLSAWYVSTNMTYLADALLEVGLIDGNNDPIFGLMVAEVAGIVADFDAYNTWWAFYIDGEMATVGASAVEIDVDTVYAFILSEG